MTPSRNRRIHPLTAAAAVSVILACVTAVAAMTGVLPTSQGSGSESSAQAVAPAAPAQQAAARHDTQETTQSPAKPAAARNTARASDTAPAKAPLRSAAAPAPGNVGVVASVREISQPGEGTGLGAVAGGVLGAVLGNQVGNGSGKKIMTVAGAAGGAYAGHEIEKRTRASKRWEVGVRLDNGTLRTITTETEPSWRSGDRVRVVNGALQPA